MSKSKAKANQEIVKDEAYWTNEVEYFEDACEGLQMAYAILRAMYEKAKVELDKVKEG